MAGKPSPTTPDRPPSLLSEFGEGYCRWCQFVVGLESSGLLAPHYRDRYSDRWDALGKKCPGSDTTPPKVTPYSSRKAIFRVTPVKAHCPGCVRAVPTVWVGGVLVYQVHRLSPSVLCGWRYRVVVAD